MNKTFWNHIESAFCCLRNDINDGVSCDIETVYMLVTLCMFIKSYNPALYEESIENKLKKGEGCNYESNS